MCWRVERSEGIDGYFLPTTHSYKTRDVDRMWEKPEVPQNVNFAELGDLVSRLPMKPTWLPF